MEGITGLEFYGKYLTVHCFRLEEYLLNHGGDVNAKNYKGDYLCIAE